VLALVFLGLLARIREMAVLQRWAKTHWSQGLILVANNTAEIARVGGLIVEDWQAAAP